MKKSFIVMAILVATLGVGCTSQKGNDVDKPESGNVSSGQESSKVDGSTDKESKDEEVKGDAVVDKDEAADKKEDDKDVTEDKKDEKPKEEPSKVENVKLKEEKSFRFSKKDSGEPEFGTPWKTNTSGGRELCIDGRGPEAIEEGPGKLLLKENGVVKEIALEDKSDKLTPNYIEWIDDENFLVNMTNKYGRVFTGATIYKVNINDLKPYIVYEAKEDEEISEASRITDDIINIKLSKYKDDGTYTAEEKEIKLK